jgi:glutamate dehydrogenase (NAD(P)+)
MEILNFVDHIGPEKIIELYYPETQLKAMVVVDNVTLGPAIGGVRFEPDVSIEEVFYLARAMTFKNAAAEIPHGGAKAAIRENPEKYPHNSPERKLLIESFAAGIEEIKEYIPGPDMGTNEEDMQVIYKMIGRATGRPKQNGGIPLDELGLTGLGLVEALKVIEQEQVIDGLHLDGAKISIEGYGNVGKAVAKYITPLGAKIVAVSDLIDYEKNIGGVVYNENGLDITQLTKLVKCGKSVVEYEGEATVYKGKQNLHRLHETKSDILVPSARTETINRNNMKYIDTKLILQGANKPLTTEAEEYLTRKGILSAPDYIVNSGGVIACAEEYDHQTVKHCIERIVKTVRKNTHEVFDRARREKISPREAAYRMVLSRIKSSERKIH